jgi:uncharacterized membrane protein required for colicin V production
VDITSAIQSINVFDLLVALTLGLFFILGFIQGVIRRLLGLGSMLFAFLVAVQLREPFGDFLATSWTQYFEPYSVMVGFGFVFVVITLLSTIAIQVFYKRTVVFEEHPAIDEILGGLVGLVQALFLIGVMIIILDSFFVLPGIPIRDNELPLLREVWTAYDPSLTASIFRATLIPIFLAIAAPFIPDDLAALF